MKRFILITMLTLSFASCYTAGHLAPPPSAIVWSLGVAWAYPIYLIMDEEE